MKKCNMCGLDVEDGVDVCPGCGSGDFGAEQPIATPELTPAPEFAEKVDINDNGNILAGVVGAFLFSLIGGLLYFVIYQVGFIAGICGLVTFVLANFGYSLFARTKNKLSIVALVTSIIVTLVTLFLAEYLCVSYEIYVVYKTEISISFFDAVRATPSFLEEPELRTAFLSDLGLAYLFSILASISNVMNIIKARKNSK